LCKLSVENQKAKETNLARQTPEYNLYMEKLRAWALQAGPLSSSLYFHLNPKPDNFEVRIVVELSNDINKHKITLGGVQDDG
jgi:hypothetical protein